uniref:Uncharacterized protein n=1 Tax=Rhizophora mucronata TaxID=61149 RepID=A0A2P2QI86_RHIMU
MLSYKFLWCMQLLTTQEFAHHIHQYHDPQSHFDNG